MLFIYKTPPAVCFSGNPIILGVRDSAQVSGSVEQKCIVSVHFASSMAMSSIYITFTYGTFVKQFLFGTDLPFTGSMTLQAWTSAIYYIFNSDPELTELFNIVLDDTYITFIEREALQAIAITENSPSLVVYTVAASYSFGYESDHKIIIRPEKRSLISVSGPSPNPITELWNFFGGGIELESLPYTISEDALRKTGDSTVYADYDLSSILQQDIKGHFDILNEYHIYDLVTVFRMLINAKRDGVIAQSLFTSAIRVIDAKISEVMQAKINELDTDLWTYILNYKKPLSWQPYPKTIDIYWPELIYIPINVTGTYNYYVREYFTDGSNASHIVATFTAEQYQVVMLSAAFLNVRSESGKTIERYEVWVEDNTSNVVIEALEYRVSYLNQPYARWWLAKNSLGVYEVFRTTGFVIKNSDIEKTFTNVDLPDYYVQTDRKRVQATCEKNYRLDVNSGPLSYAERKQFTELLESSDVYLLIEGKAIPVEIEDGKFTVKNDAENISVCDFEVTAANIDDSTVDLSVQLPIIGDFNFDFNESYFV